MIANYSRPDYPLESNPQLVDLFKRIFVKDPDNRISLVEIMSHDWVTSNGAHLVPRISFPKLELTQRDLDSGNLFKSVWMISKIKLKLRNLKQLRQNKNMLKDSSKTVKEF